MGKLLYSAIASLDGYIADKDGNFDWAEPDEQVHTFINDLERGVGTYLFGRRMYEVMTFWETEPSSTTSPSYLREFAELWRAADKIVYSRTLQTVSSSRTRIERTFEPEVVRGLKVSTEHDLAIGGPDLAAQAFKAGLVDQCHLFIVPVIVGGGTRALPDAVRLELELLEERRFNNGMVYLRYGIKA